jgi:hemolysin D
MTAAQSRILSNVVSLPRRFASRRNEREFLPAALEIIETPASPAGRVTAATIIAFFLVALVWATFGHVDIIATAQGKVVPVGRTKVIQPLEIGMVTAINVKDGDRVTEGQVLIEMDHVAAMAERNRIAQDLMRSQLDIARLTALRAAIEENITPNDKFNPPAGALAYQIARTRSAMIAQADQQAAKIAALDQQIAQKAAEADEIAASITKLKEGLPLLEETAAIREKVAKMEYGNRLADLDARLKVSDQRNDLLVQQRRAVENVAGRHSLEWQREQTKAEYARSIMTDLAEAEPKAAQFAEDLVKAEKRIHDQTLRAPIDGTVQQLAMHTIGGIAQPAQQLMAIVPAGDGIEIEAMVPNKDIGFVHEGDPAEVKIDTFNFTKYGLLHGKVISVSQDAMVRDKAPAQVSADKQSGQSSHTSEPPGQELVYAARIRLDGTKIQVEDRMVELAPGMATTVEIKTGSRRVIEFLLSPILRYRHESLRER